MLPGGIGFIFRKEAQSSQILNYAEICSVWKKCITVACRQIPIITAVGRRCLGKEHNKQRKDEGSYFLADLVGFSELLPQSQSLGCCGCASNIFQLLSVLPKLLFLQEQM